MEILIKISLKQHIGKPATPRVSAKDEVKRGQLIASPDGLGANIHSSVSGIVKEVTDEVITIEASEVQPKDFEKIKETDNLLDAIEEAGVVGAGGAGFPTHVKLNTTLENGVVIANAAECEPNLKHNIALLEKNAELVVKGLKYAMKITKAPRGIFAIKPRHKKALINLGKIIKNDKRLEIKFLPDLYPSGDERVIVRDILGVELKPGQLPLEAKAVICNVETLKNITLAIEERKPVIDKDMTIGGRVKGCKEGKVIFDVPIGTLAKDIIEKSGGFEKPHGEIIMGGAFTGACGSENSAITKTTGGIAVAMPFPTEKRDIGILACECGAQEDRLKKIAKEMGAKVVASEKCKRMKKVGNRYRCDLPGVCPGQAETVLELKKNGADVILTGTCQH